MALVADGRVARGQRSRDAIVAAMLSLIREGVARPSSMQIADRAGVTQRTLFNHFADVPTLMGEVAAAQIEFVRQNMPPIPLPSVPTEARALAFFEGFAELFDAMAPVRIAAYSFPARLPAIESGIAKVRSLLRGALEETFAPELSGRDPIEVAEIIDELEVLADPVSWQLRRTLQHHSAQTAARRAARSACKIVEASQ